MRNEVDATAGEVRSAKESVGVVGRGAKRQAINAELEQVAARHRGILKAEHVVAFAENPDTALHSKFTWDDTGAAHEYRLWQARQIINVYVVMLPNYRNPVNAFVSLMDDRVKGGGYRAIASVMSDPEQREMLLAHALADFKHWQAKYHVLKELEPIFVAASRVRHK